MKQPNDVIELKDNEMLDYPIMVGNKTNGFVEAPVFEGYYAVDYKCVVPNKDDSLCYPIDLIVEESPLKKSIKVRFPVKSSGMNVNLIGKYYYQYKGFSKEALVVNGYSDYVDISETELLRKVWLSKARGSINKESVLYRKWKLLTEENADRVMWIRKGAFDAVEVGDFFAKDWDDQIRISNKKLIAKYYNWDKIVIGKNSKAIGMSVLGFGNLLEKEGHHFDTIQCFSPRIPGQPGYSNGLPASYFSEPIPLP